ncbi:hypothetical protein J2T13_001532 [Paenibacillus sp. DS2015]|uniref:STM3941 family protein n=1 Tax=Paenibacillus sp. DS2015 TaxID=3373917 RepID=UPI003D1C72BF
MNEHVEYPSILKMLGLTLGAMMFVVIGMVLMKYGGTEDFGGIKVTLVGGLSIVVFGPCMVYFIYRLFNLKPMLIINEEGIMDTSSLISAGELKWSEIQEIKVYQFMGQKFIGIQLYDLEAFLSQKSSFKRVLMKINARMVKSPINIAQPGMKLPLEQLYTMMLEHWERNIYRNGIEKS